MSDSSFYDDIIKFHVKFELHYDGKPRELEPDLALFRTGFMIEELAEYARSAGFRNIAQTLEELHEHIKQGSHWLVKRHETTDLETQFDSLIDLTYVALGTSHMHGFNFDEGWRRVHEANMAKVRVENLADSKRGSTFDVIKPRGWKPASLADLLV
jgi:predicted HAD superfamily Cof-like phosphohydrolase